MKKWKDISGNEKWMLVLILLLLIAIVLRWGPVKEGISRSFNWFGDDTPADSTELEITMPADTFPPAQPEILFMEPEE